jgi:hypothetical protein
MSETHSIITEVTYAELAALITANEGGGALEPGLSYEITDFATVYYQITKESGSYVNVMDGENPMIKTGETEHLIVMATSPNTLDKRAKSIEYPNDIIHYDWNPVNWSNNLNFAIEGEIVEGFKGVIHFRRDTLLNNQTNHDYRNVVNRLYNVTQPTWAAGVYNEGDFVVYDDGDGDAIYYADSAITIEEPSVDAKWVRVCSLPDDPYVSFDLQYWEVGNYTIPVLDAEDFEDREWLGGRCYSCVIPEYVLKEDADMLIPLIVFGNDCSGITFGSYCQGITFGNDCSGITFGSYCQGITFGNGCGAITFGSYCQGITFGNGCGVITFGNGCGVITFGSDCREITTRSGVVFVNTVSLELDLTGDESKEFLKNANEEVIMLQYDATNTLVVTEVGG